MRCLHATCLHISETNDSLVATVSACWVNRRKNWTPRKKLSFPLRTGCHITSIWSITRISFDRTCQVWSFFTLGFLYENIMERLRSFLARSTTFFLPRRTKQEEYPAAIATWHCPYVLEEEAKVITDDRDRNGNLSCEDGHRTGELKLACASRIS